MEIIHIIFFLDRFCIDITYCADDFPHLKYEIQSFSEFALTIHDCFPSEVSFLLHLLKLFSKSGKEVTLVGINTAMLICMLFPGSLGKSE